MTKVVGLVATESGLCALTVQKRSINGKIALQSRPCANRIVLRQEQNTNNGWIEYFDTLVLKMVP